MEKDNAKVDGESRIRCQHWTELDGQRAHGEKLELWFGAEIIEQGATQRSWENLIRKCFTLKGEAIPPVGSSAPPGFSVIDFKP